MKSINKKFCIFSLEWLICLILVLFLLGNFRCDMKIDHKTNSFDIYITNKKEIKNDK